MTGFVGTVRNESLRCKPNRLRYERKGTFMTDKTKGNLYMLMAAVLWSTGGILIKFIPGNAIAINGARSFIAFLFFCAYKRNIRMKCNRYIVAAAFCLVMTNFLYVMANKLTTAANAIVLQYMAPIFVLIWDCIYQKKLPRKKQCIIVLMAFSGMILFFFDQLDGGHLLGNLLAIGAGVCFSGVFFINSLPESSSEDASMLAFLSSFLISIPLLGDIFYMDATGISALLVLGIFQVGLAYLVFSKGSKLTSPVSASLIGLLEAILNPIWVLIFYGEKVGKYALLGGAIILLSVVLNICTGASQQEQPLPKSPAEQK